jgi:hypothetical protein
MKEKLEVKLMDENGIRSFHVSYKDGYFKAYAYNASRGTYTLREVDHELEELLRKCKDAGFNHLESLSDEAIDVIYEWLIKAKPVLDYVEGIWQGKSSASRKIGFLRPGHVEAAAKAAQRADLERYGIKPTPSSDYVVTNEMVNNIRDELGI